MGEYDRRLLRGLVRYSKEHGQDVVCRQKRHSRHLGVVTEAVTSTGSPGTHADRVPETRGSGVIDEARVPCVMPRKGRWSEGAARRDATDGSRLMGQAKRTRAPSRYWITMIAAYKGYFIKKQ